MRGNGMKHGNPERLGEQAKAVCAAWFGMMRPHEGRLSFAMKAHRPSAAAALALSEMEAAGIVRREDLPGGAVDYVPLVDCSVLLPGFHADLAQGRHRFALTEPVAEARREAAEARMSITLAGLPQAVRLARTLARMRDDQREYCLALVRSWAGQPRFSRRDMAARAQRAVESNMP